MKPKVCWLFCTVIDNFGDIGVSWRLAQELRRRLGAEVWLWLDDLAALRQIVPAAPAVLPALCQGIRLSAWREGASADLTAAPPPDVMVETFACALPPEVLAVIRNRRPLWLNWEYLSAEDWAVRTHAMPSAQADGSRKYFWQMGFTESSGGLLREADYRERQRRFAAEQPPREEGSLNIYLFGYASPLWADWCDTWRAGGRRITLHVAGAPVCDSLNLSAPNPQNTCSGSLNIIRAPFVPQEDFDRALWAADILFVRGEDSFVRAQYAGKPFFWHIYPQAEMAHLDKLDAFWRLYWQRVPASERLKTVHTALSYELNGAHELSAAERAEHWQTLLDALPEWQTAAEAWRDDLFAQSDAVSRLAEFMQKNTV